MPCGIQTWYGSISRPPHAANNLLEWSRATCAARDRVRRERQCPASAFAWRGLSCAAPNYRRQFPDGGVYSFAAWAKSDQPGPKPTKNLTPTTTNATNITTSPMGTMRTSCGCAATCGKSPVFPGCHRVSGFLRCEGYYVHVGVGLFPLQHPSDHGLRTETRRRAIARRPAWRG